MEAQEDINETFTSMLSNVLFQKTIHLQYNRMQPLTIEFNGHLYRQVNPQNLQPGREYLIQENNNPAMRRKGVYDQMIDGKPSFSFPDDTVEGFDPATHTFYERDYLPRVYERDYLPRVSGGAGARRKNKLRKSRKVVRKQKKKSKKATKTKRV